MIGHAASREAADEESTQQITDSDSDSVSTARPIYTTPFPGRTHPSALPSVQKCSLCPTNCSMCGAAFDAPTRGINMTTAIAESRASGLNLKHSGGGARADRRRSFHYCMAVGSFLDGERSFASNPAGIK